MGDALTWLESQSPEKLESDIPKLPIRFAEDEELTEEQVKLLKEMLKIFPELPEIKRAELGDLGGLYGAMELLRQAEK